MAPDGVDDAWNEEEEPEYDFDEEAALRPGVSVFGRAARHAHPMVRWDGPERVVAGLFYGRLMLHCSYPFSNSARCGI